MKAEIWYMRPDWFREGICGDLPSAANLDATHVHLKDVEADNLNAIFTMMQGEVWSPEGEARPLIEAKGLTHTSMCVGDVARVDGKTLVVASFGFKNVQTGEMV
jgi:hypothetical protein